LRATSIVYLLMKSNISQYTVSSLCFLFIAKNPSSNFI